jgi:hypothetical protein
MDPTFTQLIYTESGGFAGLKRGCTIDPQALPDAPRGQLQHLLVQPHANPDSQVTLRMPDMLVYTLELVAQPPAVQPQQNAQAADNPHGMTPQHWLLQYPASDVPEDISDLIDYLRDHAQPLPLR